MRLSSRVAASVVMALAVGLAYAQSTAPYPTRPIRLINPYVPGGGSDAMTRRFAQELTSQLGPRWCGAH
jgi:tripartite-type tricarboxylate transporter receptor subunit TctC